MINNKVQNIKIEDSVVYANQLSINEFSPLQILNKKSIVINK